MILGSQATNSRAANGKSCAAFHSSAECEIYRADTCHDIDHI